MLHEITVPTAAAGQRLDRWLTAVLEGCTRSHVQRCLALGRCSLVPGRPKAGYALRGGERVVIEVPDVEPLEARPEDLPLSIVHEDAHLVVIDKPPGMVVHPAIGHLRGTLVNALLGRYGPVLPGDGSWRPGLVHRLDADTSGLIVVARTPRALLFLQDAFRARVVVKRYLALVHGHPRADVLVCRGALGRHPGDFRKRRVVDDEDPQGKPSATTLRVLARQPGRSVLLADLHTGRTHQIRVHCAHLGHPVLADVLYGRGATWQAPDPGGPELTRQALHAWHLAVPHPEGGVLALRAPPPADLAALLPVGWEAWDPARC